MSEPTNSVCAESVSEVSGSTTRCLRARVKGSAWGRLLVLIRERDVGAMHEVEAVVCDVTVGEKDTVECFRCLLRVPVEVINVICLSVVFCCSFFLSWSVFDPEILSLLREEFCSVVFAVFPPSRLFFLLLVRRPPVFSGFSLSTAVFIFTVFSPSPGAVWHLDRLRKYFSSLSASFEFILFFNLSLSFDVSDWSVSSGVTGVVFPCLLLCRVCRLLVQCH